MGNGIKIVVLDGQPLNPGDIDWTPIAALGELTIHESTLPEELPARVAGADIVLVNKVRLQAADISALKACRMAGVLATGFNNLDLPALAAAGIQACNVPNYGAEDVAQHALALLLELARGTALHTESIKSGEWSKNGWCYWLKPSLCLSGLTLGIVGFGSIGQVMGRYGSALGMNVIAWSRSRKDIAAGYPFVYADIDELFSKADAVTLHCPLTEQTEQLINRDSITSMKDGAILINTARGALVDEKAVAEALRSGKLGGFGADVLCSEPPDKDNPLLSAPNVLLTPHMAWATARARQNIIDIMAKNIKAFLDGKAINRINEANPQNC